MARHTIYVAPAKSSREERRAFQKLIRQLEREEREEPVD